MNSETIKLLAGTIPPKAGRAPRRMSNGHFVNALEAREHVNALRSALGLESNRPSAAGMNITKLNAEVTILEELLAGQADEAITAAKTTIETAAPAATAPAMPAPEPKFGRERFAASCRLEGNSGHGVSVRSTAAPGATLTARDRFCAAVKIVGMLPKRTQDNSEAKTEEKLTGRQRFARAARFAR